MIKRLFTVYIFVLLSLPITYSLGQIPYTGRFFQNQETDTVSVGKNLEAGVLEDGRLHLTEQDAIEMALANNLDINVNRHAKLSSFWDIALQKAAYDPVGAFSYDWHKTTKAASSLLEGGDKLTDILGTYSFNYTQPFSSGTSLEVDFTGARNKTSNFFAGYNPSINTHLKAVVKQDLLKGFLKATPEYEIEISINNQRLSEESFREQATAVINQVQESFWNLAAASRVVDSNNKALELARTIHEQNLIRLEVGSGSELESIQSLAEFSSRQEELIRAEYTLRNTHDALIKLISSHEDPREMKALIIPEGLEKMLAPETESFGDLMEAAAANRPEIEQIDIRIRNLEIRYDQSSDELKPSLSVSGGYEQFGLGGMQIIRDYSEGFFDPPIVEINEGGLGQSM
ncbi:MAG: TolC family protein, partial [Anaerolineales bacterium]|nr:TolC family protein [Anaerolineales bacterium]